MSHKNRSLVFSVLAVITCENSATALRELVYDRQFRRLDHVEKSIALSHLIFALLEHGETREAMQHTNKLIQQVKSDFGRKSVEHVNALLIKAHTEYRSGMERNALRTVNDVESMLDRLGDGYKDERERARSILVEIRRSHWNAEGLRKDLSDFYTACEAIQSNDKLPAAARAMREYLLVGKQYKPKGRERSAFKNTYVKQVRENSTDRKNRLIFIPDEEHLDHWCVIYPDGNLGDRVAVVPRED